MHHIDRSLIVVEDEPLICVMIEEMVQDLGWAVEGCAHTEESAFDLLNASAPGLVLLDINLGLTTSLGVAASCRDRRIPIVFMTGYIARDIPSQCGDAPVVTKPFTEEQLDHAIRRALNSVDA